MVTRATVLGAGLLAGLLPGCERNPPRALLRPRPPRAPERIAPPQGGVVEHEVLRCPEQLLQPLRPFWFTFSDADIAGSDDEECGRGTSTSILQTQPDPLPPSDCVASWSGAVTEDHPHAFSGVGVETWSRDWRAWRGLTLATKGDGRTYRLELLRGQVDEETGEVCADPEQDHHGLEFTCGDGTDAWVRVPFEFADLKQEGWGRKRPFEQENVAQLQVRTRERPIEVFGCDLYVAEWLFVEP